jgi:hypothetical protein
VEFVGKQGSLCGHTLEQCPNSNGNNVSFSSRLAKKVEATWEAWERRRR